MEKHLPSARARILAKAVARARLLGGQGSGNFGHAGRPGEIGGSAPMFGEFADTRAETARQQELVSNQHNILAKPIYIFGINHLDSTKTQQFIAAYGKQYSGAKLPKNVAKGSSPDAAVNATFAVMEHPELTFAEGFVTPKVSAGGFARLHAWAVDAKGQVVDPTIDDPQNYAYFGVKYNREKYLAKVNKTNDYGILTGQSTATAMNTYTTGGRRFLGGKGSGNFGHAGRPGAVGGSSSDVTTSDITLYHSSTDSTPPSFDAFFGGEQFIKTFSPTEFGEHRYATTLPKGTKFIDLNHDTPAARELKAEIASHAWPGDAEYQKQLREGTADETDFYEAWTDKRNILAALPDKATVVKYQDEYLVPKAVLSKLKVRALGGRALGGSGSGNFGHAGRPGEVGGSSGNDLVDSVRKSGGFTYNTVTGDQPKTGYALSLHPEAEYVTPVEKLTVVELAQYVKNHQDLLKEPNNYLGAWHNPSNGKVYLDVSTIVQSADEARRIAQEHHQLAYYDLEHGVAVDTTEQKAAAARRGFNRSYTYNRGIGRYLTEVVGPRSHLRGDGRGEAHSRVLISAVDAQQFTEDVVRRILAKLNRALGGQGSGNFGHAGRPGEVGGSATESGTITELKTRLSARGYRVMTASQLPKELTKHIRVDEPKAPISKAQVDGFERALNDVRSKLPELDKQIQDEVAFVYGSYDPPSARAMTAEYRGGDKTYVLINGSETAEQFINGPNANNDFTIAQQRAKSLEGDEKIAELYRGIVDHELGHVANAFTDGGISKVTVLSLIRAGKRTEEDIVDYLKKNLSQYAAFGGPDEAGAEIFGSMLLDHPLPPEFKEAGEMFSRIGRGQHAD